MRINKMDNLNSGLEGTRTDILLISWFYGYLDFSPAQRHMDMLPEIPEIYFNNEELGRSNEFACREGLKNWKFMPGAVHRSTPNFTTLSKALCLADYLFPDVQLYYLGDTDMNLRAPGIPKHHAPVENAYIQSLIGHGRLIPILEDEAGDFHYSSPILTESDSAESSSVGEGALQTITIRHPQWTDQFRIRGKRGCRLRRNDHAAILHHDEKKLVLQWDNWGREEFYEMEEGKYQYLSYHCASSINEVNKYAGELFINPCGCNDFVLQNFQCPSIGIKYGLLQLDRMYLDVKREIGRMAGLHSILLAGVCKDALIALMLACRLKKDFPHLHMGIWGCPWPIDSSDKSLGHQGDTLSSKDEQTREKESFESLVLRYGDTLGILQQVQSCGLHLFGFYDSNPHGTLDAEATERLELYLMKANIRQAESDECCARVHEKIMRLVKQKPEMVQLWINEMIQEITQEKFRKNPNECAAPLSA